MINHIKFQKRVVCFDKKKYMNKYKLRKSNSIQIK